MDHLSDDQLLNLARHYARCWWTLAAEGQLQEMTEWRSKLWKLTADAYLTRPAALHGELMKLNDGEEV